MKILAKYKMILCLPLIGLLAGCYDMTVQLTSVPSNTPPTENIYISGNFNNWDPGDPKYILKLNSDSVYEVRLPKGSGRLQYKFTRGDWSTVEKDPCGFEINNHTARYGNVELIKDTVRSWNDLPKPDCPSIVMIIDSLPANTPENAAIYLAANFNEWNPGSRYWMFTKGFDGKYFIEVPRVSLDQLEFKITRGDWGKVECAANGKDIDDRIYRGGNGREIRITVQRWKDR
jgi:hypothetical protein